MTDKYSLTFVEIDIDYCANTYGTAPCTAAVGVTGTHKCFNAVKTCQDRANYVTSPVTLRFGKDVPFNPKSIPCIPSIVSVAPTPAVISLGKNLGQRASVSIQFRDHPHGDTGAGFDKYLSTRSYTPFRQGSFWGKFRARHFVQGRPVRLIRGFVGDALADMETHHYIADSFAGPDLQGNFTLVVKDVLKLADDPRAQCPRLSNGVLLSNISNADTVLTLDPVGIGNFEYDIEGHVAISNKETVRFYRDPGIDANTTLLLHCDGADTSTTFTDSSATGATMTANGNAQIDTAQSKFGGASGLFDGTGDFINSPTPTTPWLFGTGDFTVDMQVRRVGAGVIQVLADWRAAGTEGVYPTLRINASNVLEFFQNSAVRITGTTVVATGAFQAVLLVRRSGVTRLFLNGVQEGADYADVNNYLCGNNRPIFGINSNTANTQGFNGWLDEIRISKSVSRVFSAYVPPTAAYSATSGDILNIVRAQKNSVAVSHVAGVVVQLYKSYAAAPPANVLYDLIANFTEIDDSVWLPISTLMEWQLEDTTYFGKLLTADIGVPTGVNALISEIIEQIGAAMWTDEVAQKIRFQMLRAVPTDAFVFNQDQARMAQTLKPTEQDSTRLSAVWFRFGQFNPLAPQNNNDNYACVVAREDTQAASDYGSSVVKQVYSRWVTSSGKAIADRGTAIILGRYVNPPRKISFDVFRGDGINVALGGGYQLGAWCFQDEQGAAINVPVQITQLSPQADRWNVVAEEAQFTLYDANDLTNRVITLGFDTNDYNLKTQHDLVYPAATAADVIAGVTLTVNILASRIIGASATSKRAFDVGTGWPVGFQITINVLGTIEGAGGDGGTDGSPNGKPGGVALYTRFPINLSYTSGKIWGGGGGGGGVLAFGVGTVVSVGGSGAAGRIAGAKGLGTSLNGNPGTQTTGGAAVSGGSGTGGKGGNPGQAGNSSSVPGTGGAAGAAIDGISFITVIGSPGDRQGAQIN